jgi:hypothetical protein
MKAKKWLLGWGVIVLCALSFIIYRVYRVDPFFHYHKPATDTYFYVLNNQRAQNDGICKHFDYDGIITGTSMTENFRASEADQLFGQNFAKVCFSGGSYREINNNITRALKANPNLKTIIRGLDMLFFLDPDDLMRTDLGEFPDYLYDNNPFNDVKYLLNRDVLFTRVYAMDQKRKQDNFKPGITSFDDYSRWQQRYTFGIQTVAPKGLSSDFPKEQKHLTDEELAMIKDNIEANVTSIADAYPDVDFYYFYTPYSIARWNTWRTDGTLDKFMEAEEYITELIVDHKNIHLFSFNGRTDITTDLNHYKDSAHYAAWINSLMLKWMHEGTYQLTEDNYEERIHEEYEFYSTFDNSLLDGQPDYEDDYYAAALLNQELTGAAPLDVLHADPEIVHLEQVSFAQNGAEPGSAESGGSDQDGTEPDGTEQSGTEPAPGTVQFTVNLDEGYNYLHFEGQRVKEDGILSVQVLDADGRVLAKEENDSPDDQLHSYTLDLSTAHGTVTVVMQGACVDQAGSADSADTDSTAADSALPAVDANASTNTQATEAPAFIFRDIYMY